MNRTKQFLGLAILLLSAGILAYTQQSSASGDRAVVPFSNPAKPGVVEVSIMRGSLIVKGYEGKEVIVEARMREKLVSEEKEKEKEEKAPPKQAAGMKLIKAESTGLTVEEENNIITVEAESWKRAVDLTIQVPYSTSLKLSNQMGGGIVVEKVNGEIEVENMNGTITLTNISGTVVADTMNGEIKVTFLKVTPDKPMSFSTMNGDIDLTLPADIKATLKMKSDRGNIYSDFDVNLVQTQQKKEADERKEGGKYRITFEQIVSGTINGGGVEFQFNTFNGDIFIRKAK